MTLIALACGINFLVNFLLSFFFLHEVEKMVQSGFAIFQLANAIAMEPLPHTHWKEGFWLNNVDLLNHFIPKTDHFLLDHFYWDTLYLGGGTEYPT